MGHRMVLDCERSADDRHLLCIDGSNPPIRIHGIPGQRLLAPTFVDERRFIYFKETNGHIALWEGVFGGEGHIRSRRIIQVGTRPSGPPLLAVLRKNAAITVRTQSGRYELIKQPLDGTDLTVLTPLGASPRRIACSANGTTVAWIDWHGEVRYLRADAASPKLIGKSLDNLLSISPAGHQIAWLNGDRIEIADLDSGRLLQRPGSADAFNIYWKATD